MAQYKINFFFSVQCIQIIFFIVFLGINHNDNLINLLSVSCQPKPDIMWRFNNYDGKDRKTYSVNHTMTEKFNVGMLEKQAEIIIDHSINAYCAYISKCNGNTNFFIKMSKFF